MPHLLEIFCGTKSVGKVFEEAGWRVTSVDLRADFEPTIRCDALLDFKPEQVEGPVDLIWASPPCTDYSKARTVAKTPRNLSDKLVQVGIDMARHFGGVPLFMEDPQSMLQHRDVVKELRCELIDYCKYGETDYLDPWPKLYRKRTMTFCQNHDWTPARPLCKKDCKGCPDGKRRVEEAQRASHHAKRIPGNRLEELYAIPPALPREILAWWNSKQTKNMFKPTFTRKELRWNTKRKLTYEEVREKVKNEGQGPGNQTAPAPDVRKPKGKPRAYARP